jgi:hypothetical protein
MCRLQQMGDTQTGGSIAGTRHTLRTLFRNLQRLQSSALGLCNRSDSGRSSEIAGTGLRLQPTLRVNCSNNFSGAVLASSYAETLRGWDMPVTRALVAKRCLMPLMTILALLLTLAVTVVFQSFLMVWYGFAARVERRQQVASTCLTASATCADDTRQEQVVYHRPRHRRQRHQQRQMLRLQAQGLILDSACYTPNVRTARHVSLVIRHTSHVTHHTSHVTHCPGHGRRRHVQRLWACRPSSARSHLVHR